MKGTGFFEESPGVKSSSRLIVATVVSSGLSIVFAIAGAGLWTFVRDKLPVKDLLPIAQAVAVAFAGTVLPAAGLHVGNKIAESKKQDVPPLAGG
jgi:hypothetical protein